ncbi:MAG: type II secretion system F family protein [Lachnospiraceae bacterium]|nr:type II secretion system F family protein [Lachnospiraceae bacterium]
MIAGINLMLFLILFFYSKTQYQGSGTSKKKDENLLYPLTKWIYEKIFLLEQRRGKRERILPTMSKQAFLEMRKKQWMQAIYRILIVFFITNVMALAVEILENQKQKDIVIERNAYGEGEAYYDFTVYEKKQKIGTVIIEVQEFSYSESELNQKYKEAKEYVESHFLGENESVEEVRSDLQFVVEVPENDIEISFQSEDIELVTNQGIVNNQELTEPQVLNINATYSYAEEELGESVWQITVYPKEYSQEEEKIQKLKNEIENYLKEHEKEETVVISATEGDFWLTGQGKNPVVFVYIMGLCVGAYFFAKEWQSRKEEEKARKEQLDYEYPVFLNQLVLLLGAGMTMKAAFKQLVEKNEKKNHYLYQEILVTMRQLNSGISEREAYSELGERLNMARYRKLFSMVVQNMSMGTKDLFTALEQEEHAALEHRKERARQLGETASTKLLFPMILLLITVMLILLVPAVLSFV